MQVGIDFRDEPPPKLANWQVSRHVCKGLVKTRQRKPPQPLAQLASVLLATFIQRQIGSAGVLVGVGPGRVTVPGEVELSPRQITLITSFPLFGR